MSLPFRPAQRANSKPLIGLYAESGKGKTWSALLLARGFVGPNGTIGMIETEGGRGEAYVGRAPVGDYFVRPIRDDFSPQAYGAAIDDANKSQLDALIIDSASHEWEGAGGVLAQAAEKQNGGAKGVLVWQQPKINHQRFFMLKLMQTPIPLVIVCMRAKYPMEQKGSEWARSRVLEPKQADDILYEMFVHGWIDDAHNLQVTKLTVPELATVFVDKQPISVETGQRLKAWSEGNQAPTAAATADSDFTTKLLAEARGEIAKGGGVDGYRVWFQRLTPEGRKALAAHHETLKGEAAAVRRSFDAA